VTIRYPGFSGRVGSIHDLNGCHAFFASHKHSFLAANGGSKLTKLLNEGRVLWRSAAYGDIEP
jgi:hypothetical protein